MLVEELSGGPVGGERRQPDHDRRALVGAAVTVAGQSTGQRRLVELARVLTGSFDVVLLDEPSSGLDQAETQQFGEILRRVVAERGIGILLVEHDMSLVRQICEGIYVLDFGRVLFEGTPEEMVESEIVRDAYLGSESANVDLVAAEAEALAHKTT